MRNKIAILTTACLLAAAFPGATQEVRGFIDVTRTREPAKVLTPEDREFIAKFAGVPASNLGSSEPFPMCQWRSPLKSPGGYAEAATDFGVPFYARIPMPRAGLKLENLQAIDRTDIARVPYIELRGKMEDNGTASWSYVDFVIPPMALPGGRLPPKLTAAQVTFGSYYAKFPVIRPVVPNAPIRVRIEDYMPDILAALALDSRVSLKLSTFSQFASASAPRVSLEGQLPYLDADIRAMFGKMKAMQTANSAKQCKVSSSDCLDGSCG